MILRNQHKQMFSVAIGGNGSNLLYGKYRQLPYQSVAYQLLLLHGKLLNAGSKVQQMLWQLNFS